MIDLERVNQKSQSVPETSTSPATCPLKFYRKKKKKKKINHAPNSINALNTINKQNENLKWLRQLALVNQLSKQSYVDAAGALRAIGSPSLTTEGSLRVTASRLLSDINENPYISMELKKIMDLDEVKEQLTAIARCPTDDKHVKVEHKLKGLELMGRIHAAFVDRNINDNYEHGDADTLARAAEQAVQGLLGDKRAQSPTVEGKGEGDQKLTQGVDNAA